jgi:hypothetical protein
LLESQKAKMDWVNIAEEFCGKYGWGARGKNIGISRMFGDADKSLLTRGKVFVTTRPRGVLSGFLAIVPSLGYAVYLPPMASRMGPQRFRVRVSEAVLSNGAIFSAYITKEKTIVVEDILVWNNTNVWSTMSFSQRWTTLVHQFVMNEFVNDVDLQGIRFVLSQYNSLDTLQQPPDTNNVLEFVFDGQNTKRIIWLPPAEEIQNDTKQLKARKDLTIGPDIYVLTDNKERLGYAFIRTLAISRLLRLYPKDEFNVRASWNKQFDKWEILDIVA